MIVVYIKQKDKKYKKNFLHIVLSFMFLLTLSLMSANLLVSKADAASMKISYNGRTYQYKKTQIKVKLDKKSLTAKKKKGILVNGTCMVSYTDIFKNGVKAKCTYSKKAKKLTIKKNGITIKMWLGKKYAYVNGKKKKLSVAPLQVRYHKGNTYKILVPAKFVATTLKYKYSYNKSNGYITLTTPFKLKVGSEMNYYTGYKGNVSYNNTTYSLSSMPAMKIGGGILVPAKEVFQNILGMSYTYNSADKTVTLVNKEKTITIIMTLGSKYVNINGQIVQTSVVPQKIKRYDTGKTVVCVPINFLSKKFNYFYSWDKLSYTAKIHVKSYFSWSQADTSYDTTRYSNAITSVIGDYNNSKGAIAIKVTGTSADVMKQTTVSRENNQIIVTLPTTVYTLNETLYNQFGEIVDEFKVTQSEGNTIMTFSSSKQIDYAYSVNENVFQIELMDGRYVGAYSLRIPKPSGVTFDMVSNTDYYNSKKFVIAIKGNHVDFYKRNPIAINNSTITNVSTALDASGNTLITIQCNKLQGYKIYDENTSLLVAMDSPRKIYSKIVVLDAGHGGHDPGAIGNNTKEKDLNFLMMYTLMNKYFVSNAPDIKAYWTRTSDTFITLSDRAAFAQKVGADIFISLHMNSWTKSSVNGTEVYYSSSNNKTSFSGLTSKKMASLFCNRLVSAMGTNNRGISSQKYTVVHKNTVPAVLLELGFISGSSDFPKLSNPVYQEKATATIYQTIVELFNSYPTGR